MNKKLTTLLLSSLLVLGACAEPVSSETSSQVSSSSTTSAATSSTSSETQTSTPTATPETKPQRDFKYVAVKNKATLDLFKSTNDSGTYLKKITYRVGDDNGFNFRPTVLTKKGNEPVVSKTDIDMDVIVLGQKQDKSFEKLSEADYAKYVESLDSKTCIIDFKQEAVGKTFKLQYTPKELTDDEKDNDLLVNSFIVLVEDGYNVTNANELAYYYKETNDRTFEKQGNANENAVTYRAGFNAFKTEKGLKLDYAPAGLFLQDNIKVTTDNLPKEFFFTEEVGEGDTKTTVTSTIDRNRILVREVGEGETFKFLGNGFNMDFSEIPLIKYFKNINAQDKRPISHVDLFYVKGDGVKAEFADFNIKGNSPKEAKIENAGGLMGFKNWAVPTEITNAILSQFYIMYEPDCTGGNGPMTIDSNIAENAFSNFLYNYGTNKCVVKNSKFTGCGGPAILSAQVTEGETEYFPKTEVINCDISSEVIGEEPWFVMYQVAPYIPHIRKLDQALRQQLGRTILTKIEGSEEQTSLNLKAVNTLDPKYLTPESASAGELHFTETINGEDVVAKYDYAMSDPIFRQHFLACQAALGQKFIYVQGADGTRAMMGNNGLELLTKEENKVKNTFIMPGTPTGFANGDTIAVYAFGFCIILGIQDLA